MDALALSLAFRMDVVGSIYHLWAEIDRKGDIMRKGKKLGLCPECHKKGLIRNNSWHYITASCRYCGHRLKAGWIYSLPSRAFEPIPGREKEREILNSF